MNWVRPMVGIRYQIAWNSVGGSLVTDLSPEHHWPFNDSPTSPAMAWITDGIIADASPAELRTMTSNYVRTLAQIHSLDWREIGLQWLEGRAEGTKPIEREVNWYWDGLLWCKDKEYKGRLAPIRDWLIANEPADRRFVRTCGIRIGTSRIETLENPVPKARITLCPTSKSFAAVDRKRTFRTVGQRPQSICLRNYASHL